MTQKLRQTVSATTAVLAVAVFVSACTNMSDTSATNPVTPTVATSMEETTTTVADSASPPTTTPAATGAGAVADVNGAATIVQEMSEHWVAYVGSVVAAGQPDPDLAEKLAALYDADLVTFDTSELDVCVSREVGSVGQTVGRGLWEHSSWRDRGAQIASADDSPQDLWTMSVIDNVVAGDYDGSVLSEVVVGPGGIIGHTPTPDSGSDGSVQNDHVKLVGCLGAAATVSPEAQAQLDQAAQPAGLAATIDGNYDARAFFSNLEADGGVVASRPALPADPNDPEPIASTGSNKWDLITTDDPTAFVCAEYLGQGPEEFLPASKDGGYQRVSDAYLYQAKFSDGTLIDMRVHPEIGSKADADAELDRYLIPLGQLPTVLRQNIGRFAVRLGDNTATASQGEGMMLQSGNASVRIADNRLEETLFHESVHTSLDPLYAYQRSQEWLDAQAADGRWLTEYGRENPDGEDLAETALYAYALLHHPDRFPAGMVDEVKARVPNRLAFIEQSIFPAGQPVITQADTPVTCDA